MIGEAGVRWASEMDLLSQNTWYTNKPEPYDSRVLSAHACARIDSIHSMSEGMRFYNPCLYSVGAGPYVRVCTNL